MIGVGQRWIVQEAFEIVGYRQIGIEGKAKIRFHDLRHSFATISLQNGDDIKTVSENLGHATVAFTLDVYGHVTDKMRKDSADRMQAYIESL